VLPSPAVVMSVEHGVQVDAPGEEEYFPCGQSSQDVLAEDSA